MARTAHVPRIVWFGFPAYSHTVTGLPIVRALVAAGAAVDYYSIPRLAPLVEQAGARVHSYDPRCERIGTPADLNDHVRGAIRFSAEALPHLLAAAPAADLVVADSYALWGRAVARQRSVPLVTTVPTFAFTRAMLQLMAASGGASRDPWPDLAAPVAALERDHPMSLRDPLDVLVAKGDLTIVHTSRYFQPFGSLFDSSYAFVGPLIAERVREGASVAAPDSRPLAYVSLGTIFNRNVELLRTIAATLSDAGWQVVVSLGAADARPSGDWPPHVEVLPFVDQIGVLSRATLMVTHGGLHSVSEALSYGVPLIVVPQAVDQPLVARRAADLGAAVVLDPRDVSRGSLEAAIDRIQRERPAFEAAARRVGESFADVPPIASVVDRVFALAADSVGRKG